MAGTDIKILDETKGDTMAGTDIKILDETNQDTFATKLGNKIDSGYTVINVGISNYSLTHPNRSPIETHWWAILSK